MIRTLVSKYKMQNNYFAIYFNPPVNKLNVRRFPFGRKVLLLIVSIIVAIPLYSQRFDGGVLAGFNGSQVRGDLMSNGFHKMGLLAGVWVQSNISDNFYWNLELKYSQKGFSINPTVKNNYYLYVYRLDYIDMPIAFGYQHKDYFSLFAGLSFDYLINQSAQEFNEKVELNYAVQSWEIAMFTGIRVDFTQLVKQEWARNFKLDFRYQFSAIPIYNTNNKLFYYSPYSHYNSVISMALYYTIKWQ
jgi:hypothetical protein